MLSDSMRVFITVADKKNFSKAAKALSLTQPAVSFQIQTLEQYYQTMLFDRVNRHVKLTAAGELLLDYAVHMNNLQAELERNMQQLTGHVKGELLVGASTTIGEYILPYVVGAFKQEYPDVNATIQIMNTNDIAENVNNKSFDLGIIEGPVELTENMESIAFLEDELVLAIPSNHPFATKESITLEELKTLPYITREPGSGSRLIFEQALIDADFDIEETKSYKKDELFKYNSTYKPINRGYEIEFSMKNQDAVNHGDVVREFRNDNQLLVSIRDENDVEFARGIANYNSDDCKRIIGNHSNEILSLLGFKNYDALITRDYITIL